MERQEVEVKYTWDLSKFYKSNEEWYADFEKVKTYVGKFIKFKGKLNDTKQLISYLNLCKEYDLLVNRLYMYCSNSLNIELSNKVFNEMTNQITTISTQIDAEDSFSEPELLSYSEEYLKGLADIPELKNYKVYFENLLRDKKHVLSEKEEKLLSGVCAFAGDSSDVFESLTNVDFKFDDILDKNGNSHELTDANYPVHLKSPDRVLRKNAFETFFNKYKSFNNTIATNYISNLKADNFFSTARNFNNTFEAALYSTNISKELYAKLKEQVNKNIYLNEEYYKLRKKALGLDCLTYYDLNVSMCNDYDRKFTFDEAKEIVLEALKPLGEDYVNNVKLAFSERWIDVYPTKDKRGGGYQSDMYGISPVILLNFVGTVNDVFTLAHELGHAMHSCKSHKAQPYETADYTIFLAEIASTFNEVLLNKYFLDNAKTEQEKLYFLDKYFQLFNGTVFRQMQYSEFEEFAHSLVANNEPISKEILNDYYFELNAKYSGGVVNDELKKYHWSIVPHFYSSFYVYKYATGLISAVSLAKKVLTGKSEELENYFKFLSAGGSDFSTNILKSAGVDLETNEPYELAFKELETIVQQIKEIVNK